MHSLDLQGFWDKIDELAASSRLVIDRPRGAAHPRYPEMKYPLDYGYLEGTLAQDGGGIDVWSGSLEPGRPTGVLLTVDLLKRDTELKILLGCTGAEMKTVLDFQNNAYIGALLMRRQDTGLDWILSRRSVRRFLPDPVERSLLERVLEAAQWAPSAHNRQPWRFAVLTSEAARVKLGEAMGADFRRDLLASGLPLLEVEQQVERSCRRIREAPAAVLLCLEMTEMDTYPDRRRQEAEYLMAVQSAAMAGENLLLAAHTLGLGGVWVCAPLFAQETARAALGLPLDWQPQGLILLGYPAKFPEARPRRPLNDTALFL